MVPNRPSSKINIFFIYKILIVLFFISNFILHFSTKSLLCVTTNNVFLPIKLPIELKIKSSLFLSKALVASSKIIISDFL